MKKLFMVMAFSCLVIAQNISDKRIVELLGELPTAPVMEKSYIARVLGKSKDVKVVPALIKLLSDDNMMVRYSAICALGELNAQATITNIVPFLHKSQPKYLRQAAMKAVGELKAVQAIPALLKRVPIEDRGSLYGLVKSPELDALCKIGLAFPSQMVDQLVTTIQTYKPKQDLQTIDDFVLLIFFHYLPHQHKLPLVEKTQQRIREILLPQLFTCCRDTRSYVKKRALKILRRLAKLPQMAIPIFEELTNSPVAEVREQAIYALVEMGQENAYSLLWPLLNAKNNTIKNNALEVLCHIRYENATSFLLGVVQKSPPEIRVRAIGALLKIDYPKMQHFITKELIPLIPHPNRNIGYYISDVLYENNQKLSDDIIVAMMKSRNDNVRDDAFAVITSRNYRVVDARIIPELLTEIHKGKRHNFDALFTLMAMKEAATPAIPALKKMFFESYQKEDSYCDKICEVFYSIGQNAQPVIKELLLHKSATVRGYAIPADYITFTKEQCKWVVPLLLEAYQKESTHITGILDALEGIDTPEEFGIIEIIVTRLRDKSKYNNWDTVGNVVGIYLSHFGAASIPHLQKILQNETQDLELLVLALKALRDIFNYKVEENSSDKFAIMSTLWKVMENPNPKVKLAAIEAIAAALPFSKKSYLLELISLVTNDSGVAIQNAAIQAIAKDPQAVTAIPFLLQMLQQKEHQKAIVETLASLQEQAQQALPALNELFAATTEPKDKKLMEEAILRIAKPPLAISDDPTEFLTLLQDLNPQSENSRVINGFVAKGHQVIPVLIAILEQEQSLATRYYAAKILSQIGSETKLALSILLATLAEECNKSYIHPKSLTRGACGTAMFKVYNEYHFGKSLQESLIQCLGNLGQDAMAALPMITKMKTDENQKVRQAAIQAIQQITLENKK
ncbi:HEAT repeat domain-containing protein [Candidatus Uabimicrobium amorphum]|uniref:Clathrin/coatomer adaptor adaptin-like N-terminal domain-containing protein n=1 Tax=Uabimicrobium amorphum TaxID=2596890 RepID=A0A5S9IS16_UABAM|nr:HEAT repeat domain-containing protein [Candidatus Uabimicrobium amorphum]BBM86864.1 hypothetical protein UABAM_05264 [Candidatus Uabimicrobium amorphum]